MKKYCNFDAYTCYQESFNKLYMINTLINMVRKMCEEREFKGEYYNISKKSAAKLSEERNDYINVLSIVCDSIADVLNLKLKMETEMGLKHNSNNCC